MGFAINTNLDALNAYQNLTNTQNSLSKSLQQLSSGLRINNAGDDAAGMTIATDIGAQVSGLTKAQANAADGTSLVQTADGALTQVQTLLGQLRDLAVQAANDSNSTSARAALTTQASAIVAQVQQIGNSTNFNGIYLLNGSQSTLNFQIGSDGTAASQLGVNLNAAGASANMLTIASALSTSGTASSSYAYGGFTAGSTTMQVTSTLGGATTTASFSLSAAPASAAAAVTALNGTAAFSKDFTASLDASGNVQITAQNGGTVSASSTSGSTVTTLSTTATTTSGSGNILLNNATNAQAAIQTIQTQLDAVSAARANIGALENRFTAVSSAISTSITNLTAAKSRITDVDMAAAMVQYSKQNILAQAGTAMLSQANSLPQLALKLLQS